jgi:hypothetical protein
MFPRAAENGHAGLALAETLAHLNRLVAETKVHAVSDREGRIEFRSAAPCSSVATLRPAEFLER